eukprot:UN04170
MATGYSPDDPIFMVLHSYVAYIRAMWATCHGYNTIAAEDLDEYPDAYTAECGEGFDECGTIELDDKYHFDILATKPWSITSKMDITPRMLWDFQDWGVKYDIGTFYDEALFESDVCPAQIFESDENRWFLHPSDSKKVEDQPKTAAVVVSVDKNNSQQSTFTYLFFALLFVVVLVFIGCLSRLRNMKKGHQYTLLSNGNHDVITFGANT